MIGFCPSAHGENPGNPAGCGGGEWIGESSIWLRQTAVGFFLGISPGHIAWTSSRNKMKKFRFEAPGRFTFQSGWVALILRIIMPLGCNGQRLLIRLFGVMRGSFGIRGLSGFHIRSKFICGMVFHNLC